MYAGPGRVDVTAGAKLRAGCFVEKGWIETFWIQIVGCWGVVEHIRGLFTGYP